MKLRSFLGFRTDGMFFVIFTFFFWLISANLGARKCVLLHRLHQKSLRLYFFNIREKVALKNYRGKWFSAKHDSCVFPYNLSIFGLNRYAPIEVCISVCVGGLLLIFPSGSAGWNLRYKNRFFHFPLCLKQLKLLGFSSAIQSFPL